MVHYQYDQKRNLDRIHGTFSSSGNLGSYSSGFNVILTSGIMLLPRDYHENTMRITWECPDITMTLLWYYPKITTRLPWDYPEINLILPWDYHQSQKFHCELKVCHWVTQITIFMAAHWSECTYTAQPSVHTLHENLTLAIKPPEGGVVRFQIFAWVTKSQK